MHLKIVKTNCKTRICLLGSFPFILLLFLGKAALCKILDSGQIFLDIAESSLRVVICQKIIRVYFWHPIHCRDKNKRANTYFYQMMVMILIPNDDYNQLLKCNIVTFSLVREVTGVNVNMRVLLLSFNDGGDNEG